MADNKKTEEPTRKPAGETPEAETAQPGQTVPGGSYIVDGVKVDANGEPIGKKKAE